MKKNLNILTISYLSFLILLFLSGVLSGVFSTVVYYLSFILPFILALILSKEKSRAGEYFGISSEKIGFTLPLIAPTVSVVMLISFLTSLLIFALTGKSNNVDVGDSFIPALLSHALLPAVLEEMLFRYLPMHLLAPYSKKGAILFSALFFSLVHHDPFSIPYAFVAGAIFMAVDLATESLIPSLLIHFINNALSVGMLVYNDNPAFSPTMYIILGVLTTLSIFAIVKNKKEYAFALSSLNEGEKPRITLEIVFFAIIALLPAVASLV